MHCPTRRSIIERSTLAIHSSYEAGRTKNKDTTPHHTTPHHPTNQRRAAHDMTRHHTTKTQRHTRTRKCICTCIYMCVCVCVCVNQHVPDSSNHLLRLIKLFSFSYPLEGISIEIRPFLRVNRTICTSVTQQTQQTQRHTHKRTRTRTCICIMYMHMYIKICKCICT